VNIEGAWRVGLLVGVVIGLAVLALAWQPTMALILELPAPYGPPSPTIPGGSV
jgi:hypothetical protein